MEVWVILERNNHIHQLVLNEWFICLDLEAQPFAFEQLASYDENWFKKATFKKNMVLKWYVFSAFISLWAFNPACLSSAPTTTTLHAFILRCCSELPTDYMKLTPQQSVPYSNTR